MPAAVIGISVIEPVGTSVRWLWWLLFAKRQRSCDGAIDIAPCFRQMTTVKCSLEAVFGRLDGG